MSEFYHSQTFHWLKGLTLVIIGGVILLQKLGVFPATTWGWVWPILILVWGIIVLYHAGARRA